MNALAVSTTLRNAVVKSVRSQGFRPMTVLSKQSAEEYKKLNYSKRMKDLGRPISPHVTIYAFPIAAISSITNRVTGCVLSFGCVGLGLAELIGGSGSALYLTQWIGSQGALVAAGAKFSVAFPVIYHYSGAIRHLAWDQNPDMLTNEDVAKSSLILFGGTTVLSTGLLFF